jgi:Phage integrase family
MVYRPKHSRGLFEKVAGSGVWWIRYRVNGVIHREQIGTHKEAKDAYADRVARAAKGEAFPKNIKLAHLDGVRFRELAIDAMHDYRQNDGQDCRNFEGRMKLILEEFGGRVAASIKPAELLDWLSDPDHGWSPGTRNRYRNVLGKTYKIAMANSKVTSNPAHSVPLLNEAGSFEGRYLKDDEEVRLREVINRRYPLHIEEFDIAIHTGIRKSEQYGKPPQKDPDESLGLAKHTGLALVRRRNVKTADVEADEWQGGLDWEQCLDAVRGGTKIKLTKTKNGSDGDVHLNQDAMNAFRALYARRPHDGRIFQTTRGEDIHNPRAWFEECVDEAGIKDFTWHSLRHTFISRLVMRGAHLKEVQELARHKTLAMTARYAHLSPTHLRDAIALLEKKGNKKRKRVVKAS